MASADRLVLRAAVPVTVGVGAATTMVGALVAADASKAALGGILATLIVVAFFTVGQLALGSVLRTNPDMALTVALGIYLLKIGALLVFIVLFQGTTVFDTKVFALTILLCTLTWTVTEVWVFSRTKILYVDPDATPGPRP